MDNEGEEEKSAHVDVGLAGKDWSAGPARYCPVATLPITNVFLLYNLLTMTTVTGAISAPAMPTITDGLTVGQALINFYNEHDFGEEGGIDKAVAYAKIGPIRLPIPNTAARKEIIWLHDLHHLLNGYDTSWRGEGQVSAWEVAAGGFGSKLYIWALVLGALSVGMFLYPASCFKAFVRGTNCRPILSLGLSKSNLMLLTISELAAKIGLVNSQAYRPTVGHYLRFGLIWLLYAGGVAAIGVGLYHLIFQP